MTIILPFNEVIARLTQKIRYSHNKVIYQECVLGCILLASAQRRLCTASLQTLSQVQTTKKPCDKIIQVDDDRGGVLIQVLIRAVKVNAIITS